MNPQTLARVAQLTQKTNQFNLTTRRYTEQQVEQMMASPDWRVWSLRVTDRYADNGLVGVAIASTEGEVCEIDTFLMSCRVIGRTVETALLARLAADARERGAKVLQGWFLPTKKNAPAQDFYREHGFEEAATTADGVLWKIDLLQKTIAPPAWIRLTSYVGQGFTRGGLQPDFSRAFLPSPQNPVHRRHRIRASEIRIAFLRRRRTR